MRVLLSGKLAFACSLALASTSLYGQEVRVGFCIGEQGLPKEVAQRLQAASAIIHLHQVSVVFTDGRFQAFRAELTNAAILTGEAATALELGDPAPVVRWGPNENDSNLSEVCAWLRRQLLRVDKCEFREVILIWLEMYNAALSAELSGPFPSMRADVLDWSALESKLQLKIRARFETFGQSLVAEVRHARERRGDTEGAFLRLQRYCTALTELAPWAFGSTARRLLTNGIAAAGE